jgi:lipoate-protein ligase A
MAAGSQEERVTSLGYIEQPDVTPSTGVATDRYLVGTLGKAGRARPGVLRVFTFPGDVLAAGRWHLAPPGVAAAGDGFQRRITGGRALALGEGYVGISLLLPHRSALVAEEPLSLTPAQVANRYVRGLMRALKTLGLPAYYPGRDLVTVNRRPIAALGFETDREGRLVFEAVLAVARPLGAVAHLLDRWDTSGVIKADLLALEGGTCIHEEIGEAPDLPEIGVLVRDAYAQQFGVTVSPEPLSSLEVQAIAALAAREGQTWNEARRRRPELPLVGTSGVQTGVLEVHFALEQGRFLKDVMIAGDLIADSPGIEALEYRLRLCPTEPAAIARVVESIFGDPAHFLLGVGPLRTVAETIMKGIPS